MSFLEKVPSLSVRTLYHLNWSINLRFRYSTGIALDLERKMQKNNNQINYYFPRIEIKKLSIPKNSSTFMSEDVKSASRVPERVILLMMPEEQWTGSYKTNPLESKAKYGTRYAVQDIFFSCNSMPIRPLGDLSVGHKCDQFLRAAYLQMQMCLAGNRPYGVDLSYEEFINGSFYFSADFTKPRRAHDNQVLHQTQHGSLRLDIRFENAISCVVNVFLLAEFPSRVSIHKDRRVVYHFVNEV